MMPPSLQDLVVYVVVALCAAYCVWLFMPAALKRLAAQALLSRFPRLGASRRLRSAARAKSNCGSACSGCASASPSPASGQQHKVHWVKERRSPPG